jgi:nitronate monooxygenase
MTIDLHRPVCDLLGCRYPIVLAGMGGVARSELVAAVTEAGGFGFLGMVREPPALIRAEVGRVRERTNRAFGVNLIPAATDAILLEAQLTACIDLAVPVVGLFWDLSAEIVQRLRDAGILVVCQIGSVQEAEAAQTAGAHALIAQGCEAGGHVRGVTPLDLLLPEVAARTDIPVLAAGGVADGVGLVTALALGAQGVVIGTAFIATRESFAHKYHKQRIVDAQMGDAILTDAFHINWPIGAQVRVLANSVTRGARGNPFSETRTIIGEEEGRPIYLFSTDSPLRSMTGDFEAMALYAGQGVGRVNAVISAGERLRAIVSDAAAILDAGPCRPDNEPVAESSSPACFAHEAGDAYMGYASREELVGFLNNLLEAERAGARVTLRILLETEDPRIKTLVAAIHRDEAKWCGSLMKAIRALNAEPSTQTGAFYDKAMAIGDPPERLAFLNRGQGWVARKLREMLSKIRDENIHKDLADMLAAHERNIGLVETRGLAQGKSAREG